MRKVMFIAALLMGVGFNANAQDYAGKVTSRDTLTNSESANTDVTIVGAKSAITIYVPVTKISGTVAGTVKYYYSIDGGTTYYLAETDTLTDASNVYTYTVAYNPGIKYRATVASTGTDVISYEVWLMYRK